MAVTIGLIIALAIVGVLVAAARKPDEFRMQRSARINARSSSMSSSTWIA